MKVFVDASLTVYLNISMPGNEAEIVENFYRKLLWEEIYTDILALDEAIYISKRKYGVAVEDVLELIDRAVLPHVEILQLGAAEYAKAKLYMLRYGLGPSDTTHLAVIDSNGVEAIATEDVDFDRTHIERVWPTKE